MVAWPDNRKSMKILHAITSLRKSAGTTTFVNGVSDALVNHGLSVVIAIVRIDDDYVGEKPSSAIPITTIDDVISKNEDFDVVHAHGLWELPLLRIARWALNRKIPIVWSPHGSLAPWAMKHHWWKKALVWYFLQKRLLKKAALFHSTAKTESEWIKSLGFNQKIYEAPLGTEIGSFGDCKDNKVVLFVGRIHPVKGLENLIKAWSIVVSLGEVATGWKLKIVGPDQYGYKCVLERIVKELGLGGSVEFKGPKFGGALEEEYRECSCLILPSFTENFGGVVVEAMAHGKPCIASKTTPWYELTEYGCGWWIDNQPEKMADAIEEMINIGEAGRLRMGVKGRELVEKKYTWEAVARVVKTAYEECK